ncbi:hypothetical protein PG997_002684 [Apiospora hydei]|uniref:Uncharacterized protein n=1 Tax=Apiospora hydei TaxID=1337664 RepID=A0ABR1WX49_9PEZI
MSDKTSGSIPLTSGDIKTVAIVGAGLSGIVSAAHLLRAGMDVTVFERGDEVGGAWIYSEQPDQDPPFPNTRPPTSPKRPWEANGAVPSPEAMSRIFAPPGPVYANMKGRGTEVAMRTTLKDWSEGTKAPIDHRDVVAYLRDIADTHQVPDKIRFRTSVDSITRLSGGWRVQTSRLLATDSGYVQKLEAHDFDAVVVATGRYGIPRVPDVPGLAQWKARFLARIKHTKQYRTPEPYRGKTVLVIGAHISALDITNEIVGGGAAKVYQSARPTEVDFRGLVNNSSGHTTMEKVAIVEEFTSFSDDGLDAAATLEDDSPIPAKVVLQDGRILDDIHHVLFATGYLASFPFLGPDLEQPLTKPQDADGSVIVTADAKTVHNLHEDIFYIPDPSLAFIGVTQYASTFSLYDIQAQFLAAVWAGRARLPSLEVMREEQRRRKGRVELLPGASLNGIYLLDDFVIRRLLDWVNGEPTKHGDAAIVGPDAKWWVAFRVERENARPVIGRLQDNYLGTYGTSWEELQSQVLYRGYVGTE